MATHILFVDDEPHMLEGVCRQLGAMSGWEVTLVDGAEAALLHLAVHPCAAVVTDLRMPGLDGTDLLATVRQRWPATARLLLSGHTDREQVTRALHVAHQFLAKPVEARLLHWSIERTLRLRALVREPRLVEAVSALDHLPTLPAVYQQITEALQDEALTLPEIGNVVERDPSLSSKVLQIVNSPLFALPRRLATPGEAAVLLGIDVLRALVLGTRLFSSFQGPPAAQAVLEQAWSRSQRVAVAARDLAYELGLGRAQRDQAFMGGLLHEIGHVVLLALQARRPSSVPAADACRHGEAAEREAFGATHGEIGALLLGLWGLPDDILGAVAWHNRPEQAGPLHRDPLLAVHLAICLTEGRAPDPALLAAIDAVALYAQLQAATAHR